MVVRVAWRGPFLSCSGFPKCRNAKSINAELREQLTERGIELPEPPKKDDAAKAAVPDVAITDTCPECGGPMKLKPSRFGKGYFLSCTKYPKCKGTAKVSPELQARIDTAATPAG
jgi:DNA topoisomerase-1